MADVTRFSHTSRLVCRMFGISLGDLHIVSCQLSLDELQLLG